MKSKFTSYCLIILLLFTIGGTVSVVLAEQISPPQFSHPASTYSESFELELTSDDIEATIYYTDDGSLPDSSGLVYQEPISISGTKMIRARAYLDGFEPSEVVTNIYSQLDHTVSNFSSDLPLVIVHQFDVEMDELCVGTTCERTLVYFSVIEQDEDGRAYLKSDDFHVHSRSDSNIRGSSSARQPKKQFGVRLIDDEDSNRNEPILGMPSENNWIMNASFDDKTLMRNVVAYQLSRDIGRYAPRTRYVELFLHSGDGAINQNHYHGIYMLTERIKWDNNRVNITKITPEDNSEPEITGGYIINHELHGRDSHITSTHRNTPFALVRPNEVDITSQQQDWIENYLGDLEEALFGNAFDDPNVGYAAYLDPESFIDHHWITEVLKEIDGYRLSTYLHKDREGRMIMGPVWDFNISLGNVDYWPGQNLEDNPNYSKPWEPEGWYYPLISQQQYLNGWYTRLFQDPDFEEQYRQRWWELRQGPFSTEHIVNMIRDNASLLEEAQQRNFERWPILGQRVWPNYFVGETYEEEIDWMVDWITQRLEWIDSQMGDPPVLPETQLSYYWYFGDEMVNNTPLVSLDAGYSLINHAQIHFYSALDGYPFNDEHDLWRKASMERRNRPTELNYRPEGNHGRPYDEETMRALQVRQPFIGDGGENTLIFDLPTTDMEDIIFSFAAMDEGAAGALLIDYSVVAEEVNWTTEGLPTESHPLNSEYQLYKIDFSEISLVNDNPDFKIRIRFDGDDMIADETNRVTFNNFSLDSGVDPEEGNGDDQKPTQFKLKQNYPNPFNPGTTITYSLEEDSNVSLKVYDIIGQQVAVLVDDTKAAGEHSVVFTANNLASGVYIYELRAGSNRSSRMMMLLK